MQIDSDNPLGAEIRREMAEAYFAACRKMVDSLEALKAFDQAGFAQTLDKNQEDREAQKDQIARRADLLDAAGERVHFVMIQREAMELAGEGFFESYDIPNEVRTRLRPRPVKGP